jgi:hypothetical protein
VPISAARSFPGGIPKSRWTEKEQTYPHRSAIGTLAASLRLENLIFTGAEFGNIVTGVFLGMHRNTLARTLSQLDLDIRALRETKRRPLCGVDPPRQKKLAS